MQPTRRVRTHPLVAIAVIAAAVTTLTVFGQSVPALVPMKKPHPPKPAPAAARPAASTAVPAWLAASGP